MPSVKKGTSIRKSLKRGSMAKKVASVKRLSKLVSKRAPSKRPSKQAVAENVIEVESLPAVKVDGRKIGNYAVVAQPGQFGLAYYAILSWTPEEYDYETQQYTVPKLYLFPTLLERDNFQEDLYDQEPNTYLQAFKFNTPVRIRSSPPLKR